LKFYLADRRLHPPGDAQGCIRRYWSLLSAQRIDIYLYPPPI
jgi:hypothetical protein